MRAVSDGALPLASKPMGAVPSYLAKGLNIPSNAFHISEEDRERTRAEALAARQAASAAEPPAEHAESPADSEIPELEWQRILRG